MEARTAPQRQLGRRVADSEIPALVRRVEELEAATAQLVANTTEIVEAWRAASGAFRVLGWIATAAKPIGYIAGACAAAWGFWKTIKGG